ncbi:MAG: tRNA (N6-isopentenyl adenosine(37)-C2)-methylthiotransferase MiaB [Oscillospiraceae bacterium]|nr:tRNA (N6-isopentenyl adenosine(37)-C2)-methylthiotransferase MiaB [Oscillospiraceae bacterium]
MQKNTVFVSNAEMAKQNEYKEKVHTVLCARFGDKTPKAFVHTYGCQGNVADSEHIKGMLVEMGYELCNAPEEADIIIYNTCAIREHAEDRVFGNVGALKRLKSENPNLIIALCGCMVQQPHITEKLKESYPFVSLIFGTHVLHRLPELLSKVLCSGKRVFCIDDSDGVIAEGMPNFRDSGENAWLPIMYGCNNFCTYCIVPYVRGRERSRDIKTVLFEAKQLINQGYKKLTLLGQNVNSYGKDSETGVDFSELLKRIDAIEGDFTFDFMTSHPRDCSERLIDTLASSKHFCGHLHLPVQSGNNRILKEMNRHYTRERYLELVHYAKEKMPDIDLTTDIIVGFPGETYEEFLDTVSLVKEVEYGSMFTFIFSPRNGTRAASMPDPVPKAEKSRWFSELLKVQEEIAARHKAEENVK